MKKKIALFIFTISISTAIFGQQLEISARGSYKSTWLFNKNISDLGDKQDYAAGWGYNYGLSACIYFNSKIGIEVDGLLNMHAGNYAGTLDSQRTYTSNVKMNSIEIPLLFKLKSSTGAYLEIGPQLGMINSAHYQFLQSYYNSSTGANVNNNSSYFVDSNYATTNISAVLGFGINIKLVSHLSLKTGIRFEYGLTDLKGVDALGQNLANTVLYPTKYATNSAAGGLFLALTWRFGKDDEGGSSPPPPPPPPGN